MSFICQAKNFPTLKVSNKMRGLLLTFSEQMNRTSWFKDENRARNYATLYDAKSNSLTVYSSTTYPDGILRTSVKDLSKYLTEIIRGFDGNGKILSKQSFQTLLGNQFAPDNLPLKLNPKKPNQRVFSSIEKKAKSDTRAAITACRR